MNRRKKLLILIEWFLPAYKAGGPVQSCANLCIALKENYEISVLTTDTDHGETTPYTNDTDKWTTESVTGVKVYYASREKLSFSKIGVIINDVGADLIYLNLLFSPHFVLYPLWLKRTGKIKGRLVLCPRGTLYDSAISSKSYKKKPLIALIRWLRIHHQVTFQATNQREAVAITRYFPGSKIIIADNLPNIHQRSLTSCAKEHGVLRCIFIARIVPIKNLLFLLQLLQKTNRQITLTVIGPIENENYWETCKQAVQSLHAGIKVLYEGPRQHGELQGYLKQQHLFILPTTGENFGHSIFEALLAGRPVLISDQTPWLDLTQNNAGWAIPLTDFDKYIEIIKQVADFNQQDFDFHAKAAWEYAHSFINKPTLIEQYKTLFG